MNMKTGAAARGHCGKGPATYLDCMVGEEMPDVILEEMPDVILEEMREVASWNLCIAETACS
ncbi:hypothetical protein VSQ32_20485 [Lachnospiraceae bacterium KK002]